MAAQAQAQAEATKEAQRAGIAHAKADDRKYLGRKPSYSAEDVSRVLGLLGEGRTPSAVSKELGLSRQAIYRIKEDPSGACTGKPDAIGPCPRPAGSFEACQSGRVDVSFRPLPRRGQGSSHWAMAKP